MALLFEPAKPEDTFPITPDYDAMMAEYATNNPEHPDPRFTKDDTRAFQFHWPATPAKIRPILTATNWKPVNDNA